VCLGMQVGASMLTRALARLPPPPPAGGAVISGLDAPDDAAVLRPPPPGMVAVQVRRLSGIDRHSRDASRRPEGAAGSVLCAG
jgi:hypothetical protein